jgi:hypothetical protein
MSAIWLLVVFWFGVVIGFGLFAAMQVSREQDNRQMRDERLLRRDDDFGFPSTNF